MLECLGCAHTLWKAFVPVLFVGVGPGSSSYSSAKLWPCCAERRRSAAATQAKKLFEGAEREVRQLRLACIHPQMTAYWRNLSAEMQLDSVSLSPPTHWSYSCR